MGESKSAKPTARKTAAKPETAEEREQAVETAEEPQFSEREVSCDGYDSLNVRDMPSMRGKVMRTVPHGFKVMAAPASGGWCALDGGGYVMDEFLG